MYKRSVLENGIRIVTDSMPQMRSIAMSVVIRAGSRNDPEDQSGIAHLTEHLMFQGTSSRDSREIAQFMDETGGQTGAFTSRDYTCYTATVLDDYYTFALDLLGDILLNSVFPPNGLEHQKMAILREIDAANDFPNQLSDTFLKSKVWADHPLGRPIDGEKKHVERLTREDIIYFAHSHYLPDRMIIAAAGNIEHEDFVSHVRDAFWRMIPSSISDSQSAPTFNGGVFFKECGASQNYFSIGIRAVPFAHSDRYVMHIVNRLLGGGISSRLFRRIREEAGLVYDISSEYHAYFDDGLMVVEGSTSPECLMEVLQKTLKTLYRMFSGDHPVGEDELWKVKNQLMAEHMINAESTQTRMSRLATQILYFDRHISTEEILSCIDCVDVDTIQRILRETLLGVLKQSAITIVGSNVKSECNPAEIEKLLANSY